VWRGYSAGGLEPEERLERGRLGRLSTGGRELSPSPSGDAGSLVEPERLPERELDAGAEREPELERAPPLRRFGGASELDSAAAF